MYLSGQFHFLRLWLQGHACFFYSWLSLLLLFTPPDIKAGDGQGSCDECREEYGYAQGKTADAAGMDIIIHFVGLFTVVGIGIFAARCRLAAQARYIDRM